MLEQDLPVLTTYEGDIYSFMHHSYNFIIEYDSDTSTWLAFLVDEDNDEEIVLESPEMKFSDMEVFGYLMTEKEFLELKERLKSYTDISGEEKDD